jgi:hypothetical protein
VHSGQQAFEADTEAILRSDAIEVHAAAPRAGTRIHLAGVHSPVRYTRLPEWVAQQLQRLCEAFPVRVRYNGVELERPLADPALPWRETAMGRVLVDLHASQSWRALPIGSAFGGQVILLRDDLPARLPDRQYLLNEETDRARIQAAVDEAFRQALMDARTTRSGPEFVASYADICLFSSNADLLNDIPWAPRAWFRDWIDHPPGHRCFERSGLGGVVDEAALDEAGVWRIEEDDDEEFTAASWLCARDGFPSSANRVGMLPTLAPRRTLDGGPVCLDDRDRQTKRCRKVRRLAQALDRRTDLCLAGPFPSPQSRLRNPPETRRGDDSTRHDPSAPQTTFQFLKQLLTVT